MQYQQLRWNPAGASAKADVSARVEIEMGGLGRTQWSGRCRVIGDASSAQIQRFTCTHDYTYMYPWLYLYRMYVLYISKTLGLGQLSVSGISARLCMWVAVWRLLLGWLGARMPLSVGGDKPDGQPANARLETVLINLVTSRAWIMKNVQNANGN